MGPERNNELFAAHGAHRMDILSDEFMRRNVVAPTLHELSEEFAAKHSTSHPVTEPTLFARLFALSQLQRSRLGIAGFNGMEPVDLTSAQGSIEAKVAPFHDEFRTASGDIYRTRVINIVLPRYAQETAEVIEIFGLNLYQPDGSFDSLDDTPVNGNRDGLVLIDDDGHVRSRQQALTGETVVLAVRNKLTNDAKLYTIDFMPVDMPEGIPMPGVEVTHKSDAEALVKLPDNNRVTVKLLTNDLRSQAINELSNGLARLKGLPPLESLLSDEEHEAVRSVVVKSEGPASDDDPTFLI